MAKLVERSFPTPEVRSSNPVIGKSYLFLFSVNCIETTEIQEKGTGNGTFKKPYQTQLHQRLN